MFQRFDFWVSQSQVQQMNDTMFIGKCPRLSGNEALQVPQVRRPSADVKMAGLVCQGWQVKGAAEITSMLLAIRLEAIATSNKKK